MVISTWASVVVIIPTSASDISISAETLHGVARDGTGRHDPQGLKGVELQLSCARRDMAEIRQQPQAADTISYRSSS